MTALAADRNTQMKDGELVSIPVKAGAVCFAGALAAIDAGYAAPGSTKLALVAVGRFEEFVDNTDGANGALSVTVRRKKAFKWENDGTVVQADLGQTAYIVDDQTVANNSATNTRSPAGTIIAIESDGVWVE